MTAVHPQDGKSGETIVITGENLQADCVAKVYMSDGDSDSPVEIIEQTTSSIRFNIPATIAPGRTTLMVLTAGNQPKMIEQVLKVMVHR
jgi:siroheme synthase (precorrin-2 oxidase/ferrochelatase)